jgi:flagellar biosynthesis/type III secretory pathway chaperone
MQTTVESTTLNRLTEILTQEVYQCRKLLELTVLGRDILAGNDPDEITTLLKKLETWMLELKVLASARTALMSKLAQAFNIPPPKLNLRKLADLVPEPFAPSFREFGKQLKSLAQQIQSAQLDNAYITQRAIDYVNTTLRVLVGAHNTFRYSEELNQNQSNHIHTLA